MSIVDNTRIRQKFDPTGENGGYECDYDAGPDEVIERKLPPLPRDFRELRDRVKDKLVRMVTKDKSITKAQGLTLIDKACGGAPKKLLQLDEEELRSLDRMLDERDPVGFRDRNIAKATAAAESYFAPVTVPSKNEMEDYYAFLRELHGEPDHGSLKPLADPRFNALPKGVARMKQKRAELKDFDVYNDSAMQTALADSKILREIEEEREKDLKSILDYYCAKDAELILQNVERCGQAAVENLEDKSRMKRGAPIKCDMRIPGGKRYRVTVQVVEVEE